MHGTVARKQTADGGTKADSTELNFIQRYLSSCVVLHNKRCEWCQTHRKMYSSHNRCGNSDNHLCVERGIRSSGGSAEYPAVASGNLQPWLKHTFRSITTKKSKIRNRQSDQQCLRNNQASCVVVCLTFDGCWESILVFSSNFPENAICTTLTSNIFTTKWWTLLGKRCSRQLRVRKWILASNKSVRNFSQRRVSHVWL